MSILLPNTIGELIAKHRHSGGMWVTDASLYMLWFEFLAISPSYELARRFRAGKCTPADVFPTDFDRVLSVFDDLGDIQKILFRPWWKEFGLLYFGYQGNRPAVTQVAYAPHSKQSIPDHSEKVAQYYDGEWVEQGRQRTMLLAVPVGLPEGKMIRQIKKQLAKVKAERRQLIKQDVKYPLVGKRHHKDVLMRYLGMAWLRSAMHTKSLWRVGAKAKVSPTYSPELDPKMEKVSPGDRYDREMLTIIASRALLRARMISENAARGHFPSHATCHTALDFDLKSCASAFNAAPNGKSVRLSVSIASMAPESSCGANISIRFYGLNTVSENTCVNTAFPNTMENNLFGDGENHQCPKHSTCPTRLNQIHSHLKLCHKQILIG